MRGAARLLAAVALVAAPAALATARAPHAPAASTGKPAPIRQPTAAGKSAHGAKPATTTKPDAKPAAPPDADDPKHEDRHTVRAGETLGGIASRAEVPRILIIEANGLKPPYAVREGQVLVIPRRRSHVVKAGETGFAIAMDYGVSWSAIAVANGIDPKGRVRAGQTLVIPTLTRVPAAATTPAADGDDDGDDGDGERTNGPRPAAGTAAPIRFAWPAPGKVRRGFVLRAKGVSSSETRGTGSRTGPHDGIDIAGTKGDPVRAAAPGLVWFAGKEPNLYGNVVIIDHGRGWFSAYAKLSKVTVRKGELVRSGERVGLIGNTGSTTTTELHFEIRRNTVPRDPQDLLPKR